jgi:hypothetical protein
VAQRGQRLDRAGDGDVEPIDTLDHLGTAQEGRPGVGPLELLPGRLLRCKSIGLVLESPDSNPRHSRTLRVSDFR